MISQEEVKRLADLARIHIDTSEVGRFARGLENILAYFVELKEIDTARVISVTGGAENKNVFREDEPAGSEFFTEKSTRQFPENKDGFLKVPPVFSASARGGSSPSLNPSHVNGGGRGGGSIDGKEK